MKVAFIGAGHIAKFHLQAFRHLGADVTAVCTRTESGAAFAKENGIAKSYRSIPQMLEEVRPDAVCVLTQPVSYIEILTHLKPLNVPVLLEKPIGYTVKEAEALIPFLPAQVFVGQNRRFYGGIRAIRERVQGASEIFAQLFLPERAKDFSHRDELTRNSWHMLNGIHGVDLLTYLIGSPKRIMACDQWGKLEFTTLPRFNVALYEAERSNRAVFMTNFDSAGGWRIHLFLPQEEIIISPFEETKIKRMTGVEVLPMSEDDKLGKPGFIGQARCFLEGVKTSSSGSEWVSFESGLSSMRAIQMFFGEH